MISATGALLSDTLSVQAHCGDEKRYKAATEEWERLTGKILDAYDTVLRYFDEDNPNLLEQAFEVMSVSLVEQRKLLLHLPPALQSPDSLEIRSFLDGEPDARYEVFLEGVETLLNRREIGALERRMGQWVQAIKADDELVVEDLDAPDRKEYDKQARQLIKNLQRLTREKKPDKLEKLFEEIEELIEERVALQSELLS